MRTGHHSPRRIDNGLRAYMCVMRSEVATRPNASCRSAFRVEQLSCEHPSKPRNPDLAGDCHRTSAIEVWGRGRNRVIEACSFWGIEVPTFNAEMGVMTVTFRAEILPGGDAGRAKTKLLSQAVPSPSQGELIRHATEPRTLAELMAIAGHSNRTRFRAEVLAPLLDADLLEMTEPDRPKSPMQRCPATAKGRDLL